MDTWKFIKTKENNNVYKYTVFKDSKSITFKEAMQLLRESEEFREEFIKGLSENPFKAYFFETPPVNSLKFEVEYFEFVLVNSKELTNINTDLYAFQEHFKKTDCVVTSFANLGRDAILIVPCPTGNNLAHYAHLATFVRDGSHVQVHEFWKRAAVEMEKRVAVQHEKHTWMSTSGLGISWLHVRLDSSPKYYTYMPYRVLK